MSSIKHLSSAGSMRGLGGSSVSRMSSVRSSASFRAPSMQSCGIGSAGSYGFGLGSAGTCGSSFGYGSSSVVSAREDILSTNEKETMQVLNDRLASYLDKVRSLEMKNAQLDKNIREWYEKQVPYMSPDFQPYFKTIEELHNQILQASNDNANILLQIDNAQLAADDFRTKYENEAALRQGVEADINGLRRVLDDLLLVKKDLEGQLQTLTNELATLKKNHEEEVNNLRSQLGARVNVEVEAPPALDLNKVLTEIRDQYENIMANNLQEAEKWFLEKSEELNQQMTSSAQQLQTWNSEIIELRHTAQTLEIDLQAQINLRENLENALAETEARYSCQLAQLQDMISNVEAQLGDLRSDLERQNFEYRCLMDVKTHLEKEISTYKQLLDGEDLTRGSISRNTTMISSGSSNSVNMGGMGGMGGMGSRGGSGSMSGMGGSGSMSGMGGSGSMSGMGGSGNMGGMGGSGSMGGLGNMSGMGGSGSMGGMGGSGNMGGSGSMGGSGGISGIGKPRIVIDDVKETYSQSKN
ncbi:keratin, type I cytoskeletal 42-like [Hyla sarda]|uniref:keratin, type I cytoskeletal 42-like n=1 Tax=Hyla sarda TaxID=327740 RepID=UPI0024C2B44B|nr:keratin, type I cytoskeletal 42-like [Hyla sarda]